MRLIDVDALPDDCAWCSDALIEAINDAPTVDAVPREKYDRLKENAEILSKACAEKKYVVRCKDCVYWDRSWQDNDPNYHYCPMVDGVHRGDFYCAHADIKG